MKNLLNWNGTELMHKKTILIIDGHSQIYRAYYAPMQDLTSPTGESVKAVYLFLRQLKSMLDEFKPSHVVVCLDGKRDDLERRQIYPEYKRNRKATPSDIITQIRWIKKLLCVLDVPYICKKLWEADDVIATLVKLYCNEKLNGIIVTGDKDLYQTYTEHTQLYDASKKKLFTTVQLEELKGYTPLQSIAIQTLMGDSTDNIPGIAGIGKKNAEGLVARYGNISTIRRHIRELKPAQQRNIMQAAKDGTLDIMTQLVTLKTDVPLKLSLADFEYTGLDYSAAQNIFDELGFRKGML